MCRQQGAFGPLLLNKFHLRLVPLLLVLVTQRSAGSGVFQLQIESVRNVRGETALGTCCDEGEVTQDGCRDACETYVRVCLKEFMDRVTTDGYCTFGNYTTDILGGNEFRYPLDSSKTLIQLPFDFAWLSDPSMHFYEISYRSAEDPKRTCGKVLFQKGSAAQLSALYRRVITVLTVIWALLQTL
ncbi:Protein jagged-2 [Bulinus truncatus]|nr:Protein jagged-2 [Bulinus truncatus]